MLESWKEFYAAAAGASSAMAGLVFVARSINLTQILCGPGLSARAAETIIVLSAALMESWKEFYAAAAGASSAMAGLVFVALSINLTQILCGPGLSARAAETIIVLSAALIAGLAVRIRVGSLRVELDLQHVFRLTFVADCYGYRLGFRWQKALHPTGDWAPFPY